MYGVLFVSYPVSRPLLRSLRLRTLSSGGRNLTPTPFTVNVIDNLRSLIVKGSDPFHWTNKQSSQSFLTILVNFFHPFFSLSRSNQPSCTGRKRHLPSHTSCRGLEERDFLLRLDDLSHVVHGRCVEGVPRHDDSHPRRNSRSRDSPSP